MFWTSWLSKPQPERKTRSNSLRVERLEAREVPAVGGLDLTFNGTGTRRFEFSGPTDGESAAGTAVQADGKIVVAGTFAFNNGTATDFAVARFNANGTLDSTFGNGGRVFIDFSFAANDERASSVAIQDDGKIVVAGTATIGGDQDFVVARLTTAGVLDTTFSSDGQTSVSFGGGGTNNDVCFGVATQVIAGARKVVLVGSSDQTTAGQLTDFAVVRLNENGSLDTSFNTTGRKTHTFGATDVAQAVAIDASNRIVLAGYTGTGVANNFAVLRLTAAGAEDGTFGTSGERTVDFSGDDRATAVAVQSNGRIVVAGSTTSNNDFAIARFNSTTGLDLTFSGDGIHTVTFGSVDVATSLVVQADGGIVVGGYTSSGASGNNANNFAVLRLTSAGVGDTTFSADGEAPFDLGGDDRIAGLALDRKGNIVVAGSSNLNATNNDFALARVTAHPETSTVGVFDSSTGNWYLRNSNSAGGADVGPFAFGAPGWIGFTGDWDGNGTFTPGVYDPVNGTFYLRNSNSAGGADVGPIAFGPTGATVVPVVGDWDGDGVTTIGTFDTSNAVWYFRNSNSVGPADAGNLVYGAPGWRPVVGDWDGNGTTTIGVFDPGGFWYLRNSVTPGAPDFAPFAFGHNGWKPVAGDWDGNGTDTPGVFDPGGNWFLRNSNSAGGADVGPFAFGAGAWTPVSGDWNFPAAPLLAAGGEKTINPATTSVTQAELDAALAAAMFRLQRMGVDLSGVLANGPIHIQVGFLDSGGLGTADQKRNLIVIDDNAAGYGWFVDATPTRDEEFVGGKAKPGSAADGKMDLVSVIAHELGHLAGLGHSDLPFALMGETLGVGTRRFNPFRAARHF